MSEDNNKEKEKKKKSKIDNLVEMWKDKRGRAKIKLGLYLIFFIGVIIFARVLNYQNSKLENNNLDNNSFITELKDNFEYDINININEDEYNYHGRKLGNNESITRISNDNEDYYYAMSNKYYELDNNGNYILTTKDEVYSYINYKYFDINYIKELINIASKENDICKVKLSTLILNNTTDNYITITVNEENKSIVIDYTELFKIDDDNINKVIITMTFSNISQILSLEE